MRGQLPASETSGSYGEQAVISQVDGATVPTPMASNQAT